MFFGKFYNEADPDSNKKESEKARHNRDVLLCITAVFGLVAAVVATGNAVKQAVK